MNAMNMLKGLAVAAAVTVGSMTAANAGIVLPTNNFLLDGDFKGGSAASGGNSFNQQECKPYQCTFTDNWEVDVVNALSIYIDAGASTQAPNAIQNFTLNLLDSGLNVLVSTTGSNVLSLVYGLTSGTYYLQVTGLATKGSSYSISATAVPVPPAAALLVTGMAGLGYLGRRRAKKGDA